MTREEIDRNAETYKAQVFKILDPRRTEVRFNSEWLEPLRFEDLIMIFSPQPRIRWIGGFPKTSPRGFWLLR